MDIKFTIAKANTKTIKPGDKNFLIKGDFTVTPRAGFDISKDCPYNHLQILQTCIDRGWLKPVAHVTEKEYIFMGLTND
jgi:hypothetical protein